MCTHGYLNLNPFLKWDLDPRLVELLWSLELSELFWFFCKHRLSVARDKLGSSVYGDQVRSGDTKIFGVTRNGLMLK